ncbi:hypothetical protein [Effusibacillus lacus]|uniref:Uncharacterized protein n=1 Tax=Effusibacillus lacus TaxID=1348429 RepID=A0A292YJF6_9BACL|nr:hypothetical protein [Effusibacillus lacus]TCS74819.1 hypothetical protein EDD64_111109 [Effusibacillus lacus]GAX88625.1 hypothetical protein EFBL_0237 [Effusibacillus lacus]
MSDPDHDYIDVDEEHFLDWIRHLSSESPFDDLFSEERYGVEPGPHGE